MPYFCSLNLDVNWTVFSCYVSTGLKLLVFNLVLLGLLFFFSLTSNYGLCFPHPGISQLPSLFSILVESETPELNIIEIMRSHHEQRCWAPAEQSFLFLPHFLWADWAPSRLGFPSSEESCVCEAQALSLLCWVLWNTNSAALAQRAERMFGVCKHWALKVISEFTLVQ